MSTDVNFNGYFTGPHPTPSGTPDVWCDDLPPGGYVCGKCGQPTESEPCAEHQPSPDRERLAALPCLVQVDGALASGGLIPGATYRVGEVREHWEPTGVEGEPPKVTTAIRFDPAGVHPAAPSLDVEALAEAIAAVYANLGAPARISRWYISAARIAREYQRIIEARG